ncbi:unnamed protein product [Rhizoctonia solani]|uniref:Uncharacterized protein n=1 Tax=Rhizoctonia solani TaxID=456999 RepID=A0A8H2WBG3_9AGAM|nr:unnamed protein product [Rhizoctonia solani]
MESKPGSVLSRPRSATVGSGRSGKSSKSAEEFGNKAGASTKTSITSSFKSFASNLIRSKPTPAPALAPIAIESSPSPSPPRPVTPPTAQGPGPHTIRLIPSPGPNLLPRSRSAADILEGVAVPAPAFHKIANELAEAEKLLNEEEVDRVSFGFGAAGYEDEDAHDVTMGSISLPTVEQHEENNHEDPFNKRTSFVFGSPQHSVTNAEFGDAAAAVLREMNARMGVTNTSQALNIQQLHDVMSNVGKPASPIKTEAKSDVRFVASHDKEFAKMDSIANHFSVRSRKRKSEHTADVGDTVTDSKFFTVPRLSTAADADDSERTAKRARISTVDDKPTAGGKAAKDTPAVRAQLESRRKSSRTSGGVANRKSAGTTQPTAKGGFGLMKMVRGIWGSKEKERPKEQPKDKENERPVSVVLKKFPSVPTDDPLPNLPAAPKSQIVSGPKQSVGPSKIAPKAEGQEPGPGRSFPIAPKPRAASGLYTPTAASLARRATTSSTATKLTSATGKSRGLAAVTAPAKPVITKATLVSTARLPSPPTTKPANSESTRIAANPTKPMTIPSRPASRALPVPPTSVGRAFTSGAMNQGSARVVSPTMRRAATTGRVTSPTNGRKSVVSPGSKSPNSSIFRQPVTSDGLSMRGSAPTVQPFRLNNNTSTQPLQITKRNTISSPSKPATRSPPPATRPIRRPRISRSKVIAKLGEKRAAVGSPRANKTRSSIQGRTSLGVKPGPTGVDAAKAKMRKSEAARRRSRVVDKGVVGRRSEGAVLRR